MGRPTIPLWQRFNSFWIPEPFSGCWIWTGDCNLQTGYGQLRIQNKKLGINKKLTAHRLAWTLYHGEIPKGLHVLHRCDTHLCVNPNHLFLGTNDDNIRDMHAKDRHVRGERSPNSKLTGDQVREMRASGQNYRDLAKNFNVAPLTAWDVLHNKTWKHI